MDLPQYDSHSAIIKQHVTHYIQTLTAVNTPPLLIGIIPLVHNINHSDFTDPTGNTCCKHVSQVISQQSVDDNFSFIVHKSELAPDASILKLADDPNGTSLVDRVFSFTRLPWTQLVKTQSQCILSTYLLCRLVLWQSESPSHNRQVLQGVCLSVLPGVQCSD